MKVRVPKKIDIFADTFQLTKKEIESQAISDLSKYSQLYTQKYGKQSDPKLDIDNFIQVLWGIEVVFEEITQNDSDNDILGYLDPVSQKIYIDPSCENQARINFTIAHEAGHLSLHSYMFDRDDSGKITGWRDRESEKKRKMSEAETRREWQANCYASAILAPEEKIKSFLSQKGVSILLGDTVDMNNLGKEMQDHFTLSRQAMEIRLKQLNIPITGSRYS